MQPSAAAAIRAATPVAHEEEPRMTNPRAATIVGKIVGCPAEDAQRHLEQADGDVKTAILIGFGLGRSDAAQLLQRHGGNLRSAINESKGKDG